MARIKDPWATANPIVHLTELDTVVGCFPRVVHICPLASDVG